MARNSPADNGANRPVNLGIVQSQPEETEDCGRGRRREEKELDHLLVVPRHEEAQRSSAVGNPSQDVTVQAKDLLRLRKSLEPKANSLRKTLVDK